MKNFLLKALLQPFLAILFCLLFGVPFVYFGFQSVQVEGRKDAQGAVTIDFSRKHFWGIWQVNEHVENVQSATLMTNRSRRAGVRHSIVLTSGVFLETEAEAIPLMAGSSNIDDNLKWEVVDSINEFINDPGRSNFAKTFSLANVFGWVGLPFLALGILGLIGWPGSIVRHIKEG